MAEEVFIVDALRTPFGRIQGGLSPVRPDDLLAGVLRAICDRNRVPPEAVDEVLAGCANQAGEDNRNVARMALLIAGLPDTTPGLTLNRLCASGLSAVNTAARQIALGEADLILAGGVESMSRAPLVVEKGAQGFARGNRTLYDTALGWRFPNPKLEARFPLESMGETAENLAERYQIERTAQDAFATRSHARACAAQAEGRFADEIVPVEIPQRKGPPVVVSADEGPRAPDALTKLPELRTVFRTPGTVTAGNASTLNDGAAVVLLASRRGLDRLGRRPEVAWRGGQAAGVDPTVMGIGPVPALGRLFARLPVAVTDLAHLEVNEAFAAQALAVLRELSLPEDDARVNPSGGAIALGHPLGASGARLVAHVFHGLRRRRDGWGAAALCVGVGQGEAAAFERVAP